MARPWAAPVAPFESREPWEWRYNQLPGFATAYTSEYEFVYSESALANVMRVVTRVPPESAFNTLPANSDCTIVPADADTDAGAANECPCCGNSAAAPGRFFVFVRDTADAASSVFGENTALTARLMFPGSPPLAFVDYWGEVTYREPGVLTERGFLEAIKEGVQQDQMVDWWLGVDLEATVPRETAIPKIGFVVEETLGVSVYNTRSLARLTTA